MVAVTDRPDLEAALTYEAPEVVSRLQHDTGFNRVDSELLFRELKRWLWACACVTRDHKSGRTPISTLLISPELHSLDEAWHTFLMFTREYQDFCESRLGTFIHHVPLSSEELEAFEELCRLDTAKAREHRIEQLRPQLDYLYDLVGADTLKTWYQGLPALP